MVRKVIIMGAAGMDFHTFNTVFRDNEDFQVLAFTATQIPDIDGRTYPKELAGSLYPEGIPIYDESEIVNLINKWEVDEVVLAYSDLLHEDVMHKASLVNATGADFKLIGSRHTQIKSSKPVISICAVRTGCGKSQTTRRVVEILKAAGHRVVAIRHPMPYGDLVKQAVQRFADYSDLDKHECTIEEREEYEPHIDHGIVVYAGVDYGAILAEAEKEADIILWDGGNNDISFYKSDLHIVIADPHRAGHELLYYPGETNLRMADVVIINKIDTAEPDEVEFVRENIMIERPEAVIIDAASPLSVEDSSMIKGKRVLVIEDGPTVTHGGMEYGAGYLAAMRFAPAEIVSPVDYAVGSIKETFDKFPHLDEILPAMGYGEQQVRDLEETIRNADCDVVVAGTPIDLNRVLKSDKPIVRVQYSLQEIGKPDLTDVLKPFLG
jgi:predicted GTPase